MVAVTSLCFYIIPDSEAVSFDCTQAKSKVEKMICNEMDEKNRPSEGLNLSYVDDQLELAYLRALERTDDRERVRQMQRHWLKEVRDLCQDRECVMDAYFDQMRVLDDILTHKCYWLEPQEDQRNEGRRWKVVEPVCRDMEANLNQFCDQPPMACELKIAPQFKEKFTFPQWQPIGKPVTLELIEAFLRAPWGDSSGVILWESEYRPEVEAALAEKRLSFTTAELDLYNMGRVRSAYRLDYGNCHARNPGLNERDTWGEAVKSAPVKTQYGPEVVVPLLEEYSSATGAFIRGHIFQYGGKTYSYWMHGYDSPGPIDAKAENWLSINRSELYHSRVSPNYAFLATDNVCYFNYRPLEE